MYQFRDVITWGVQRLILITTAIYAVQLLIDIPFGSVSGGGIASPPGGLIIRWLSFQPSSLFNGAIWQPFTYMFLHGNLPHLFFNMLWLFFFGPDVERVLGTRQFVRFYLLCGFLGVFASLLPVLFRGGAFSITGASGAVMGVMVAFAMINPTREFFLFPLPVPINARALVMIVIGMNILTAWQGSATSVATHFGGMAVGFAYMKSIPKWRAWRRDAQSRKTRDKIGDAVNNIFKFEDKKGPRQK